MPAPQVPPPSATPPDPTNPSTLSPIMTADQLAFLSRSRFAVLATIAPDGSARLVPVCFALRGSGGGGEAASPPCIYIPLDEKPKRHRDPHLLARVRDISARPAVTLLVERWDEDWTRLAWLRLDGTAGLLEPDLELAHDPGRASTDGGGQATEHALAVGALRRRYEQYREHRLEDRPLIRISVHQAVGWGPVGQA